MISDRESQLLVLPQVHYFFVRRRGSLLSAAIFVYAASAPVNGFAGGSMYARFGGQSWIKQVDFVVPNQFAQEESSCSIDQEVLLGVKLIGES